MAMLTVLWQTKTMVSFPLEDKVKTWCEWTWHNMKKSWPHTRKYLHMVHFNVPHDWSETNSLHQKRYSEGGKRNCGGPGLPWRVIIYSDMLTQWLSMDYGSCKEKCNYMLCVIIYICMTYFSAVLVLICYNQKTDNIVVL